MTQTSTPLVKKTAVEHDIERVPSNFSSQS